MWRGQRLLSLRIKDKSLNQQNDLFSSNSNLDGQRLTYTNNVTTAFNVEVVPA